MDGLLRQHQRQLQAVLVLVLYLRMLLAMLPWVLAPHEPDGLVRQIIMLPWVVEEVAERRLEKIESSKRLLKKHEWLHKWDILIENLLLLVTVRSFRL